MAIEISNLSKRFGAVTALDDVSLRFEGNKIYGLLGENGAGKSTLMTCVAGRQFPDSGSVTVDGHPATGDAAMGQCFLMSEDNLYPENMRVRRAFDTARLFYPDFDMDYALALADKFELELKRPINKLSTGYASIFRLVLSLSVNTPYLLLDEPVLGLDARHRDLFYRCLLEKYVERPSTIVISTHLIAEVADIVEHTVILCRGKVVRDAPTESLTADVFTVAGPAAAVEEFLVGKTVLSQNGLGGLKTACVQGRAPETLPDGLELNRVNLQDYFISLMNEGESK